MVTISKPACKDSIQSTGHHPALIQDMWGATLIFYHVRKQLVNKPQQKNMSRMSTRPPILTLSALHFILQISNCCDMKDVLVVVIHLFSVNICSVANIVGTATSLLPSPRHPCTARVTGCPHSQSTSRT